MFFVINIQLFFLQNEKSIRVCDEAYLCQSRIKIKCWWRKSVNCFCKRYYTINLKRRKNEIAFLKPNQLQNIIFNVCSMKWTRGPEFLVDKNINMCCSVETCFGKKSCTKEEIEEDAVIFGRVLVSEKLEKPQFNEHNFWIFKRTKMGNLYITERSKFCNVLRPYTHPWYIL